MPPAFTARATASYGRDCALLAFRASPRRVRRVMRENGLLAPHRVLRTEAKLHDGAIVTDKVNEMWGTDMTQTITIREGRANVFVAVEHANSEVVGIHASRSANSALAQGESHREPDRSRFRRLQCANLLTFTFPRPSVSVSFSTICRSTRPRALPSVPG
jgi:transposase InsO family protein